MRIDDVGPNADNATLSFATTDQSVSGKVLSVALSADGARAYLGGHSGVWRSDDGGNTWWHPEWPEPAAGSFDVTGALPSLNVYDVAISPTSHDVVFARTANDAHLPDPSGIYRSNDGGQSWTLQHQFVDPFSGDVYPVGQIAIAADDPQIMFAAGGVALARSQDGGTSWLDVLQVPLGSSQRAWHVVIGPASLAGRRVYAAGNMIWESLDGGDHCSACSV